MDGMNWDKNLLNQTYNFCILGASTYCIYISKLIIYMNSGYEKVVNSEKCMRPTQFILFIQFGFSAALCLYWYYTRWRLMIYEIVDFLHEIHGLFKKYTVCLNCAVLINSR